MGEQASAASATPAAQSCHVQSHPRYLMDERKSKLLPQDFELAEAELLALVDLQHAESRQ
jgi:hypothetical protein